MEKPSYLQLGKKYIRKPWVIGALVIIILVIVVSVKGKGTTAQDEVYVVKSGTVSEEVSVTGKVKAAQAVDLSFEKSGKVTKANKAVGDDVKAGDIIVQIDNADVAAQLAEAQASLRIQQSKLNELESGTRPEQLAITKTKTDSAKADLDNAKVYLVDSLQNAYALADDAIRNKVDVFFLNPRSTNPQILFIPTVTAETSLESGRVEVETRLQLMNNALKNISSNTDTTAVESQVKQSLGEIRLFLDNISLSINALIPTDYLPLATLTTWKANVSSARTSVNTAITNVLAGEDKIRAAQSAYNVASGQLTLDTSGTVSDEISAQEAQVAVAQANVAAMYAQYAKTFLKAPIDGIVTKQDAKLGETATPNIPLVSVMSNAQFQIEANIPEADIAKIKTGQTANVTLDAYGPDVLFHATVVLIDPAETIVDGVPTYKTTFQFEGTDVRIKSGMTANVDIQGEVHTNVLSVPQRAVVNHNGEKIVTIKTGPSTTKEVPVKLGIRGSDGAIEITDGLSVGDNVIISQK